MKNSVLLDKLDAIVTKQEHKLIKLEMQINQWEKEITRNAQRIAELQEKMRDE